MLLDKVLELIPIMTHLPPPRLCSTGPALPERLRSPTFAISITEGMARSAAYKRRSSPAIYLSSYVRESGDSEVDGCHMPEPQLSNPRKRLHSEQCLPQVRESSQPLSKRQKLDHPRGARPPAAFWDNLSKIWLTERALKELDWRNTQPAPNSHRSPYRRSHRPVTRHAVAEWKNKEENQPATDFLTRCSTGRLEDIKLLARHGGPDLSDLRGVRIARCLLELALIILSLV